MSEYLDWPAPAGRRARRPRFILFILIAIGVAIVAALAAVSFYVDLLWFGSLGYASVFWKTFNLQWTVFLAFAAATFVALYLSFLLLRPARFEELARGRMILIGGRPLELPIVPILRFLAPVVMLGIAVATGAGMAAEWPALALYFYAPAASGGGDPIFGRPLNFYLFTLPAWEFIAGWIVTIAVILCAIAIFFILATGGTRALSGRRGISISLPLRGLAATWSILLLAIAIRVYLSRFELLFEEHTVFAGVTYTDAHVMLPGLLLVSMTLVLGAAVAAGASVSSPRLRWLVASIVPAAICYVALQGAAWYVGNFIVKPNELVREQPYIAHNIELTRQAYGLDRIVSREFPADTSVEAADAADNQATLQNIRLWDWRALQDTLRQIQEIRTYYDFPDIDIDRYEIGGTVRQVMLAARELSVDKLPESSQNWINERLIYTHGYGVTMNPVNGFTPEGMPELLLSDMPVHSAVPGLTVTQPEIYFGEMTNTDVYVKTAQREFNYPQGQTNNLTSYEGAGGIAIGGFLRRCAIALDEGDLSKLPFSDDVKPDSRLLMRRSVRERVAALAPFLTFDQDPYIVVRDDGRLSWIMDAFTTSDRYPYSTPYRLGNDLVNYMRNSVKVVIDAYDGTTTFYVFDPGDPIIAAYRAIFPALFKDASAMPPDLRKHVRFPELLLKLQAAVYSLYHMTDPEAFYNREDLWAVATETAINGQGAQASQPMDPNFVLMKLPGEDGVEFIEMLPFTPANRNNLIGWIAGRSDGEHYGGLVAYDFPKTKLVDGPLQVEARIDQNAQLSGQLTLWNQQGSHVRRGTLLVIPTGRALLYAEPIYLQAEQSPMPELRLVVMALQDRLAYGPTFEAAMASLFGGAPPSLTASAAPAPPPQIVTNVPTAVGPVAGGLNPLIDQAAKDLEEYQQLTAQGKLGEAGQKLEMLKSTLDELRKRRQ